MVTPEFDNSGEARAFLSRYVSSEDAGGWSLIEVYDTRGEDAERLAFWEREGDGLETGEIDLIDIQEGGDGKVYL